MFITTLTIKMLIKNEIIIIIIITRAEELRGSVTMDNFKKPRFEIRNKRAMY